MKKFVCLILIGTLMLLFIPAAFAIYDGEILFRDIPWDTDIVSFKEQITSEIQPYESEFDMGINKESIISYFDDSTEYLFMPYIFRDDTNCAYSVSIFANQGVYVAGLPLSFVSAEAIHKVENGIVLHDPDKSKLIQCRYHLNMEEIPDGNIALNNLKEKLISIYGDVDISLKMDIGMRKAYYVWLGASSYVSLNATFNYKTNAVHSLDINYGRLNTLELLNEIEKPESTIDFSSTDGL